MVKTDTHNLSSIKGWELKHGIKVPALSREDGQMMCQSLPCCLAGMSFGVLDFRVLRGLMAES